MIINLSNEYKIVTDEFQFIVQRMSITQAGANTKEENIGKEVWKDLGYFPKINSALKFVAKNILLSNNDLDIIINKLNLLDIKIEEIRSLLENTRINELLEVIEGNGKKELEESEEC